MARPKAKGKKQQAAPAAAAKKASGKGKAKQTRAAAQRTVSKDVFSDDEDEAKEARMNAQMDIDGVYEYEQPETFEQDSEIDEDEAFNSEDEQSYGMFFQKGKAGGKKAPQSEEEEEDDDDEEEAGGDLLSDMLGSAPAKRLSTIGDDDEDALTASDDEASDDETKHKGLLSFVDQLVPAKQSKKQNLQELSEGQKGPAKSTFVSGELTLGSLLGAAATESGDEGEALNAGLNLNKVKKQVRDLDTEGGSALHAALAPVQEERAGRKIAYVEKKKDVDLFQTVVRRNRQKETMDFREQIPKLQNLTPAALTDKFSAQTSMEKQVEALLKAGDLSDRAVAADEQDELARNKVSEAEVKLRQHELSKMRALMFYEEQKQRRVKKIKSKLYHKIRNNQNKKEQEKHRKQLRELDPEMADQLDKELAEKRAEERMTLKHTNTSKWVKHQLGRGINADNDTRAAIAKQLQQGQELRRKMRTAESDEDDDISDDEDEDDGSMDAATRLQKRLEKKANALVMEIDEDQNATGKVKGLQGMKFMQRAVQKQREKARSEAEKLLREIKGEDGLLSDDDYLSSGDEAKKSNKAKDNKKKAAKVVVTAEDKEAVAKALPQGALQTGNVSMDKGLSARASGTIAVDLGNGVDKSLDLSSAEAPNSGKVLELGGKKKAAAKKQAEADAEEEQATADLQEGEENPWLTGAATKTKKRSKKKGTAKGSANQQNGTEMAQAMDALAKSMATQDAAAATANASGKKRKLDQAAAPAATTAPVSDDSKKTKKSKKTKGNNGQQQQPEASTDGKLSQEELVRRAFAFADEDEDEITREKELIADQDTQVKKGAEIAKLVGMTGWGSWAGEGVKTSFRQKQREEQAKKLAIATKKQVLASRKDSKMDKVLINEKKDKRAAKFTVQDVPYPFTSREEYEMAMRNPLGSDWNTPSATNTLTAPKVITRAGKSINPLQLTKEEKKQAKKDLGKQRKAKF